MKIVVLDGYPLNPGDLSWDKLESLGSVEIYDRTPQERVVERAAGAGAVLTNKVALRESALREISGLRYIGVTATGYDIIDIPAAREIGITVTNIPAYGTNSVAQLTIALLLELCHHAGRHSEAVRSGEWCQSQDWCFWKSPLVELAGKTLGVIGFGRIGRRVAEIAHALGMQVLASSRSRQAPPAYKEFAWANVEETMKAADVVTLHCPLTPETKGLINAERLRLMKPSALLVNTSRGGLVVEQDLADTLNEGGLAGAALDVLSSEPPSSENPLLTARNCIITPHLAWATREARARLMRIATDNLQAFLEGQPRNVVNP